MWCTYASGGDKFTDGVEVIMRLVNGLQQQRQRGRYFHTGREFIIG